MTEVRLQKSEDRSQRTEDRGQKADYRLQSPDDRGRNTEIREFGSRNAASGLQGPTPRREVGIDYAEGREH